MRITPLKKNVALAFAAVFLLSVSAGGFAFAARSVARGSAARSAIAARINDLARERAAASAGSSRSRERSADLERIKNFFVRRSQPVAFVEQVEATAKHTGNIATLDADDQSGAGDGLVFRITLEGTRKTVVRFVRALDSMPYLARVEEMNFQAVRAEEGESFAPEPGARLLLTVRVRTE